MNASFVIYGFSCSPQELSLRLGIEPDEIGIKGMQRSDKNGISRPSLQENFWQISLQMNNEYDFEKHIIALLSRIEVSISRPDIYELKKKISIFGFIEQDTPKPGGNFSHKLLSKLAKLQIDLEIDLY